jgi:hypothetical protein
MDEDKAKEIVKESSTIIENYELMTKINNNISFEIDNNPCIIDSAAFLTALDFNIKKFINDNYRD